MPEQHDDLAGFATWLRKQRMARENRIPYFIKWVRRFQVLARGRPPVESWYDTLSVFLEDLEQGGVPDWQIRQAADAVTLFCSQFRDDAGDGTVPGLTEGSDPASPTGRSAGESSIPESPEAMISELGRVLRLRHYSPRTVRSYLGWVRRYLEYLEKTGGSPGSREAKSFLSQLATVGRVAASTQNQAFNALLFLHRNVLHDELADMSSTLRARRGRKLPVVLSVEEVRDILSRLEGTSRLMIEMIYGGGLRLSELVRLRVKDIDFDAGTITVRSGKGDKDRVTLLPDRLHGSAPGFRSASPPGRRGGRRKLGTIQGGSWRVKGSR